MLFRSFAKLNLHLEVRSRREDGYHELLTVFQSIDLADEIRLDATVAPGIELVVSGQDLPVDRRNLAWRAAEAFRERYGGLPGGGGLRIDLRKRIPTGAGLGGGSADAAAVLLGLARMGGLDPFEQALARDLAALGARLGADVPFQLVGGTAIGRGRGDEIEAVEDAAVAGTKSGGLWLALPPYGLATAEIFARWRPRESATRPPALERARAGGRVALEELIGSNDLEEAAFALRPELGALYTALVRSGARRVRMSGSGSTLFAIFDTADRARGLAGSLPSGTGWVQVSTLGRAAWRRAGGFDSILGGG
jgi:4-diphosphocytidyl-2-C-methyl-D-erythritol kinase